MTHPADEETDGAVSRRVEHPTEATESDERAYAAADPDPEPRPDVDTGGEGGTAERAARDTAAGGSEPTRSE